MIFQKLWFVLILCASSPLFSQYRPVWTKVGTICDQPSGGFKLSMYADVESEYQIFNIHQMGDPYALAVLSAWEGYANDVNYSLESYESNFNSLMQAYEANLMDIGLLNKIRLLLGPGAMWLMGADGVPLAINGVLTDIGADTLQMLNGLQMLLNQLAEDLRTAQGHAYFSIVKAGNDYPGGCW